MMHELKCKPEYFKPLVLGTKNSEVRYNDRDYNAGDVLWIREFGPNGYTGLEVWRNVTHVLDNFVGLSKGFVCLSLGEHHVGIL